MSPAPLSAATGNAPALALALFGYAFISNVALAVVPHEPAIVWAGARAPFAVLAISGVTPLPFFPFKALAFAARYPLGKYLAAIAVGRLPRYLLLAWVGYAVHIPAWLLVFVFVLLLVPLIPTVRMLLWPRHDVR